MEIKKVGIVGAGQMGNGIADVIAMAGYDVAITDASSEVLARALDSIDGKMGRRVAKELITSDAHKSALARIKTCDSLDDFADRDLVIEAIVEKEEAKRAVFAHLVQCAST